MKASQLLLPALLTLGLSPAATAQTQPANTSTVSGGTLSGKQTGTTTQPSTMQNGASIGNNRDVLSPGTGTAATLPSAGGRTAGREKHKMHDGKSKKMKSNAKMSDMK